MIWKVFLLLSQVCIYSGSGKSYLAKLLRDMEVENGGTAPRIHSMDDYFMTEVEKVLKRIDFFLPLTIKRFLKYLCCFVTVQG